MTDSEAAVDYARDEAPADNPGAGVRPYLTLLQPSGPPAGAGARRALNVVAAMVLLIIAAPVALVIAILVKLTSRGPILYRQTRVGLDQRHTGMRRNDPRRCHDLGGMPFTMYKFRTMGVDAENGTGPVWATKDDPRVTSIGRVLRQCRLDELPQLVNVLAGDMNLVGPRPERPAIAARLRREIPLYQQRHRALPGITGRAQVNLEYDASVEDVRRKVQHDLEYIRCASPWEDAKIMVMTIPVVLFRRGAR
jgi:lipopolysaccharide/colanic/teichoic acid biosynthesis glycosyltransferase